MDGGSARRARETLYVPNRGFKNAPSCDLRCTGAEACATIMVPVAQASQTVPRPIRTPCAFYGPPNCGSDL